MSQYMALYRKWRPSVFADVIGQEHITKVLQSEVMQGSVSHAYLFCGSRGTGKTTCAKILARAISCENPQNGDPCGECACCKAAENSFDIVEMDAASNNGVENIRELREKISFTPIELKKRVYIIDEVHMLSDSAFNALLKTLEEPPAHAMFILATTELNKIPATILSRCKRFDFHRINPEDMIPRLRYISDSENIGIDTEALRLIANLATGAMRDALSMLELFVGQNGIDAEKASKVLGVVGNASVLSVLRAISEKDAAKALEEVAKAYNASKDMSVLCSELGEMFRNLLVMKYASKSVSFLVETGKNVIDTLREVEDKFTPEYLLYATDVVEQTQNKLVLNGLSRKTLVELMIMRLCDPRLMTSPEALNARLSALETNGVKVQSVPSENKPAQKITAEKQHESKEQDSFIPDDVPFDLTPPPEVTFDVPFEPDVPKDVPTPSIPEPPAPKKPKPSQSFMAFAEVLEDIKNSEPALYSFIVDARASLNDNVVTLEVSSIGVFMISGNPSFVDVLSRTCSKYLGYDVSVKIEELSDNITSSRNDDLSGF